MFDKKRVKMKDREAIIISGLGEYDLEKTMECGQCFRYERIPADETVKEYQTVVGNLLIDVCQTKPGELIFFDLTDEDFERVAAQYFALTHNLSEIKENIKAHTDSKWLGEAADASAGIAILKQDPWEALVSFIISQNNNIPRIRKIVREICAEYGVNLYLQKKNAGKCPLGIISDTPCEEKCKKCGRCYTFPTPSDILNNPEGLLPSRPGFRYGYILDAAEKVYSGQCDLEKIRQSASYEFTREELKKIKGVGDKVAACVALFGFNNLEAFPIDVWMKRAIDTYFNGELDPLTLGPYAGIAQQYIFNYIRYLSSKG